jgi:hypothetical protein
MQRSPRSDGHTEGRDQGRRADRRGQGSGCRFGKHHDATWKDAQQAAWSDAELAEAFAYLGPTVFTGYLNYAQTDPDFRAHSL